MNIDSVARTPTVAVFLSVEALRAGKIDEVELRHLDLCARVDARLDADCEGEDGVPAGRIAVELMVLNVSIILAGKDEGEGLLLAVNGHRARVLHVRRAALLLCESQSLGGWRIGLIREQIYKCILVNLHVGHRHGALELRVLGDEFEDLVDRARRDPAVLVRVRRADLRKCLARAPVWP